jgi:hypothetical protein
MEAVSVRPDFDLRLRAAIHRAETVAASSSPWHSQLLAQPWRPALVACSMVLMVGLSYGAYRARVTPFSGASPQPAAQIDPKATLEYFGNLVSGANQPGLPSGWIAVNGNSPEALRLQNLYLNASQGLNDYVVETMNLDDPNTKKPGPCYVMPVERSDDMLRKVSY